MTSFEEILIQSVFLRPCLYDKLNPDKRKKNMTDKAWKEVATDCEKSIPEVKKRWKSLRDRYFKESKKLPSGSGINSEAINWQYYESLLFLSGINIPKGTLDNYNSPSEAENSTDQNSDEFVMVVSSPDENSESFISMGNSQPIVIEIADNCGEETFTTVADETKVQSPRQIVRSPNSEPGASKPAKRSPKESIEDKWCKVIDKLAGAAEVPESDPDSPVKSFTRFIAAEMRKMTDLEQDEMKFFHHCDQLNKRVWAMNPMEINRNYRV